MRDVRPNIVGPGLRPVHALLREHKRRPQAQSLLDTTADRDRQVDARAPEPGWPEPKFQDVAQSAGRVKIDGQSNGGNGRSPRTVQHLERNAKTLREPLL